MPNKFLALSLLTLLLIKISLLKQTKIIGMKSLMIYKSIWKLRLCKSNFKLGSPREYSKEKLYFNVSIGAHILTLAMVLPLLGDPITIWTVGWWCCHLLIATYDAIIYTSSTACLYLDCKVGGREVEYRQDFRSGPFYCISNLVSVETSTALTWLSDELCLLLFF